MSQNMFVDDSCLVVSSCDSYNDLWPSFFKLLASYWPERSLNAYLLSESFVREVPGVERILTGHGLTWSRMLLNALESLEESVVILVLDDFFLRRRVDGDALLDLVGYVESGDFDMIRLNPRPGGNGISVRNNLRLIQDNANYRVSTQAAIWKKSVLIELLLESESPWEFEINGTKRSRGKFRFACVEKSPFPYSHHVVQRGKFFPWAVFLFRIKGVDIRKGNRCVMSLSDCSKWACGKVSGWLGKYFK